MNETEKCNRCNRKLRDPKSKDRGFGRCCWKKYNEQKAKEEFERNQQKLEI